MAGFFRIEEVQSESAAYSCQRGRAGSFTVNTFVSGQVFHGSKHFSIGNRHSPTTRLQQGFVSMIAADAMTDGRRQVRFDAFENSSTCWRASQADSREAAPAGCTAYM